MKTPTEVHSFLALWYGGRGYVKALANALGKSKANISQTINGLAFNYDTRQRIAAQCHMPADKFWEPEFDFNCGLKGKVA